MNFPSFQFQLFPVERRAGYGAFEFVALVVGEHDVAHVGLDLARLVVVIDRRRAFPLHPEFRVSEAVLLESSRSAVDLFVLQFDSARFRLVS